MERCTSRLPRQLRRWDDLVSGPGPASVVSSVAVVLLLEALVIGKDVAYVGGANATENSGRNFELMVRFFGWRDDSVCVCVCVCVCGRAVSGITEQAMPMVRLTGPPVLDVLSALAKCWSQAVRLV